MSKGVVLCKTEGVEMKNTCHYEQTLDFILSLRSQTKLKLKVLIALFIAIVCLVIVEINGFQFSKAVATTEYMIIDVETVYDEVEIGENYTLPQFVTAYYAKKATSTIATTIEMEVEWDREVDSLKAGIHVVYGVLQDLNNDNGYYNANNNVAKAYIKVGEKIEAGIRQASFDYQDFEPNQDNKLPINKNGIRIESEYRAIENGQCVQPNLNYALGSEATPNVMDNLSRMLNFTNLTKNDSIKITVPKYVNSVTISYKPISISMVLGYAEITLKRAIDGQAIKSDSITKQSIQEFSLPCDCIQCENINISENGNEFYINSNCAFLLSNVAVETMGGFVLQDTDKYIFSNQNEIDETEDKDGFKFCGWYQGQENPSSNGPVENGRERELQAKFVRSDFSVGVNPSINALRFVYIITYSNADERLLIDSLDDFVGEFHLSAEGGREEGFEGSVNFVKVDAEASQIQFAIQITNIPEDKKDVKVRCLLNLTIGGFCVISNSLNEFSFNSALQEVTN